MEAIPNEYFVEVSDGKGYNVIGVAYHPNGVLGVRELNDISQLANWGVWITIDKIPLVRSGMYAGRHGMQVRKPYGTMQYILLDLEVSEPRERILIRPSWERNRRYCVVNKKWRFL